MYERGPYGIKWYSWWQILPIRGLEEKFVYEIAFARRFKKKISFLPIPGALLYDFLGALSLHPYFLF